MSRQLLSIGVLLTGLWGCLARERTSSTQSDDLRRTDDDYARTCTCTLRNDKTSLFRSYEYAKW
jgi:hypothetical protein